MQTNREKIKAHLASTFRGAKIRETKTDLKLNVEQLTQHDLATLDMIPANVNILIKRSGTGLVIIIS